MLSTLLRPFAAFAVAGLVLSGLVLTGQGLAQQSPASVPQFYSPAQQSGVPIPAEGDFVLRAVTRLVVEDLLVTDVHGDPVLGLPQKAFHITDDGKPQVVLDLDETRSTILTGGGTLVPAGGHGAVSNAEPVGNQGSMDVLLLDPIGMQIEDQMFLQLQARQYIRAMPPAQLALQTIAVAHGARYLLLSVVDLASGRTGTAQLTIASVQGK